MSVTSLCQCRVEGGGAFFSAGPQWGAMREPPDDGLGEVLRRRDGLPCPACSAERDKGVCFPDAALPGRFAQGSQQAIPFIPSGRGTLYPVIHTEKCLQRGEDAPSDAH